MTYRNRIKKSRKHLNPPYWFKAENAAKEPDWYIKWFGITGHKVAHSTKYYSGTIDPLSGKYIGWNDNGCKERGLKKRHRLYARTVIAEQLLFMAEMKPCSHCGSDFCENPLSCKDEEEMLCTFEIENYNHEVEDYFLHDDEWENDYEYDYYADDDYWY